MVSWGPKGILINPDPGPECSPAVVRGGETATWTESPVEKILTGFPNGPTPIHSAACPRSSSRRDVFYRRGTLPKKRDRGGHLAGTPSAFSWLWPEEHPGNSETWDWLKWSMTLKFIVLLAGKNLSTHHVC